MNHWKDIESNISELKLSDSFKITLYRDEGYAIATGVDGKIGLKECDSRREQEIQAQETVITVLSDLITALTQ